MNGVWIRVRLGLELGSGFGLAYLIALHCLPTSSDPIDGQIFIIYFRLFYFLSLFRLHVFKTDNLNEVRVRVGGRVRVRVSITHYFQKLYHLSRSFQSAIFIFCFRFFYILIYVVFFKPKIRMKLGLD